MKVFKKICFLLLLLIAITPSVTHAEESFVFIGKHPHLNQRTIATVIYVGESNINFEQAIFLKFNEVVIKIFGDSYTNIKAGDQIIGRFNDPDIQDFHVVRTEEYLEGRVICKRMPKHLAMSINEGNARISDNNNTYSNNKIIKGNNNISRNNVYIAGDNNTITGNTHKQGSNNVYENNIVIGGSNNDISNTNTEGASNQVVQGQVIDKSGGGSSSSSGDGGSSSLGGSYSGSSGYSSIVNYYSSEEVHDPAWTYLLKIIAISAVFLAISYRLHSRSKLFDLVFQCSLWIITLASFFLIISTPIILLFVLVASLLFCLYHRFTKSNTNKFDNREPTYHIIPPPLPPTITTHTLTSHTTQKPTPQYIGNKDTVLKHNPVSSIVPKNDEPNLSDKIKRTPSEKMQPLWERKTVLFEQGYIGCKASKTLHSVLCSDAEMIKESNRIFFKKRHEAIDLGYTPCKKCKALNRRKK